MCYFMVWEYMLKITKIVVLILITQISWGILILYLRADSLKVKCVAHNNKEVGSTPAQSIINFFLNYGYFVI